MKRFFNINNDNNNKDKDKEGMIKAIHRIIKEGKKVKVYGNVFDFARYNKEHIVKINNKSVLLKYPIIHYELKDVDKHFYNKSQSDRLFDNFKLAFEIDNKKTIDRNNELLGKGFVNLVCGNDIFATNSFKLNPDLSVDTVKPLKKQKSCDSSYELWSDAPKDSSIKINYNYKYNNDLTSITNAIPNKLLNISNLYDRNFYYNLDSYNNFYQYKKILTKTKAELLEQIKERYKLTRADNGYDVIFQGDNKAYFIIKNDKENIIRCIEKKEDKKVEKENEEFDIQNSQSISNNRETIKLSDLKIKTEDEIKEEKIKKSKQFVITEYPLSSFLGNNHNINLSNLIKIDNSKNVIYFSCNEPQEDNTEHIIFGYDLSNKQIVTKIKMNKQETACNRILLDKSCKEIDCKKFDKMLSEHFNKVAVVTEKQNSNAKVNDNKSKSRCAIF